MIETASLENQIDPFQSFVIGDKISDVQLAQVSGGRAVLVRTGYGKESEKELAETNLPSPNYIADNLLSAVEYLKELDGDVKL